MWVARQAFLPSRCCPLDGLCVALEIRRRPRCGGREGGEAKGPLVCVWESDKQWPVVVKGREEERAL